MQTEIYCIPKTKFDKYNKGLISEIGKDINPIISFWNVLFPTTHLRPNPDIMAREFIIELPIPKWKRRWQRIAIKMFNFKIGRIHVITICKDGDIKRFNYDE
jgi:hypothetical protein